MTRQTAAERADLEGAAGVTIREAEAEEQAALEDEDQDQDAEAVPGAEPELWRAPLPEARPSFRQLVGAETAPGQDQAEAWQFEIPPTVAPYLKPDEQRIIPLRRHHIRLAGPALAFAGGLAAAASLNGWAWSAGHARPIVVHLIWWTWAIGAGWAAYKWLEWRQTWFVVTGYRLMLIETTRLLGRRVRMLPLDKLRDAEYSQTSLGRVCGYATFTFASIGTGSNDRALAEVDYLPWPEWLYQRVSELTMPSDTGKVIKRGRKQ